VAAIVDVNEREDLGGQVVAGGKVAESQAAALEGVEPKLDLIEPARVKGQVVDRQAAGMGGQPGFDVSAVVSVQVVEHEVNHLTLGDVGIEQVEKVEEDLLRPAQGDHADDLSGMHEQAGREAAGAVADVLNRAPTELARPTGESVRESPLQGLHAGLLVGADDRAVGRRVEIEVDHRAHLGLEVGIDGLLPIGASMGLDCGRLQDALDAPGADPGDPAGEGEDLGQQAATPIRMTGQTVGLGIFAGGRDDQATLAGGDEPGSAWPSAVGETGNAFACESTTPLSAITELTP
jgi:hypothetical protein